MSHELYQIQPIVAKRNDEQVTAGELNTIIREVNTKLHEIALAVTKLSGEHGSSPTFGADIDMKGHSLLNVGEVKFSSRKHATSGDNFTGEFAVDDPADSPGSADILRDDLVDNVLPDIRVAIDSISKELLRLRNVVRA